jgi:RimJ/RimL family protein N-acetyltransferase
MKIYKCLNSKKISIKEYSISTIQREDIENIRQWRNNQINVLRQKNEITKEEQNNYFERNIWPTLLENEPNQILLSYFHKEKLIGYGGLVHISWEDKRAELSFVVDDIRALDKNIYKQDFEFFLILMKFTAFEIIKLNRIFTETYSMREFHISIIENSGFLFEGKLREHVIINNIKYHSLIHGIINSDYKNDINKNNSTNILIN